MKNLNFDTLLGEIFRNLALKNISCNISILKNSIYFDFYSKGDIFEIYYSENLIMGNVNMAVRILDFIKNNDFEYTYIVTYKDNIFNINERFKNLQNAQGFCDEINNKFELNIKPEVINEGIKKN